MRVFLSLPDVGIDAKIEETIRAATAEAKHEILPGVAAAHAGLAASERARFLATVDRMMEADMLVADVSASDAGIGWCIAWFATRGKLIVLTCQRDARAAASAMIIGNPSPWQRVVLYDQAADLRSSLIAALS